MTAKDKTIFICNVCGSQSPKWQGKCFECNSFNSYQEERVHSQAPNKISQSLMRPTSIQATDLAGQSVRRLSIGVSEVDDILAGGTVGGQTILVGGEPGVGKSTLVLQFSKNRPIVYFCGEENSNQVALRARRLNLPLENITLIDERDADAISEYITHDIKPTHNVLVIVDSIQSVYSTYIKSVPGSISQVQYCANILNNTAKTTRCDMVIIGQITKEGYLAGPKLLEHLVDTVLYLDGDKKTELRILRVVKNRFGSSDGVEIFVMGANGLEQADAVLGRLIESRDSTMPGTVLSVVMEGKRPIVIEVQALNSPMQYGNVRRIVNGISLKRFQMLLAVLERRAAIKTSTQDIYANVSGGLKVADTSIDLALCLAVASVVKNKRIPEDVIAFGEIGLLGEIKPVPFHEKVYNEAKKRGYRVIVDHNFARNIGECIRKLFG